MELPHLGQHCSDPTCKQLDFLPMKCDACSKIFCGDHYMYSAHSCTESYKKDNQIPVCPLCNKPCPLMKGELPDVIVGRHIETDCQSDPAKERRKVYTNRCSKKGCKRKELVPVNCDKCRLNYCLGHRHEQDHSCQGFQGTGRVVTSSGAAALFRYMTGRKPSEPSTSGHSSNKSTNNQRTSNPQPRTSNPPPRASNPHPRASNTASVSSLQGTLTEDEALARALQQSMNGNSTEASTEGMTEQEKEDFLLAQALSMSEQDASHPRPAQTAGGGQGQRTSDKCALQ